MTDLSSHPRANTLGVPRHPGFLCAKSEKAIVFPARWHLDALVQAALDPEIKSLAATDARPDGCAFAFMAETLTGVWFTVALTDGAPLPSRMGLISWTRSQVLAEPRRTNARAFWSRRETPVSVGDRVRILRTLTKHGAMPMGNLDRLVLDPVHDPYDVIAALVCEGALAADLTKPITPEGKVWRSNAPPATADQRIPAAPEPAQNDNAPGRPKLAATPKTEAG